VATVCALKASVGHATPCAAKVLLLCLTLCCLALPHLQVMRALMDADGAGLGPHAVPRAPPMSRRMLKDLTVHQLTKAGAVTAVSMGRDKHCDSQRQASLNRMLGKLSRFLRGC
jgi:hypothetical protein